MFKAHKVRLHPTEEQKQKLNQSFGNCRFVYNYFVSLNRELRAKGEKILTKKKASDELTRIRNTEKFEWLNLSYSQCQQQALRDLFTAYKNFFDKSLAAKEPTFKSKDKKNSIRYAQFARVEDGFIFCPGVGKVKGKARVEIPKLKNVTISRNAVGHYFASICYDDGLEKPQTCTEGKAIGIDVGLREFANWTDSEGNSDKVKHPKHFEKYQRNLKVKQQKLSRKKKGSNNRLKAKNKVARVQRRIANSRLDFLHKLSRKIVDENQIVIVEDLCIKGLMRGKQSRGVSHAGWGTFFTLLKYKLENLGKVYQEVGRFYPSSKICSHCGTKNEIGAVKYWECKSCGTQHDRDLNASNNILIEGLRILGLGHPLSLSPKEPLLATCSS
jgi:putative transposase